MSFYISIRGVLERCLFDSKGAAQRHAVDISVQRGIPLADVLVIKASSQPEAENKSAKHFGY